MDFTKKAGADPYADPYAFDLDAPKATKFNSHELKAPAKKAEIEEDIDDFMESRDDKKQSVTSTSKRRTTCSHRARI
jgi:hypothetical protein